MNKHPPRMGVPQLQLGAFVVDFSMLQQKLPELEAGCLLMIVASRSLNNESSRCSVGSLGTSLLDFTLIYYILSTGK